MSESFFCPTQHRHIPIPDGYMISTGHDGNRLQPGDHAYWPGRGEFLPITLEVGELVSGYIKVIRPVVIRNQVTIE